MARERSAELRGLLAEIAREHGINRALMRQELAFLSHLTRLVGNDAEPATTRAAPQERLRRRTTSWTCGCCGPLMPISSFYGLQTSLRGLLAQQRMLDTAGHNIANASTQGYSRQEVNLDRLAGAPDPGGRHGQRRPREPRLRRRRPELPPRARRLPRPPVPRPGHQPRQLEARSQALDRAELALQEPGDNGINAQLSEFWDSWSDLSNAPSDPAARQALLEQGAALADSFRTVYDQLTTVGTQAMAEYADLGGPRPRRTRAARSPSSPRRSRPSTTRSSAR
jgi:hypothetical protein